MKKIKTVSSSKEQPPPISLIYIDVILVETTDMRGRDHLSSKEDAITYLEGNDYVGLENGIHNKMQYLTDNNANLIRVELHICKQSTTNFLGLKSKKLHSAMQRIISIFEEQAESFPDIVVLRVHDKESVNRHVHIKAEGMPSAFLIAKV